MWCGDVVVWCRTTRDAVTVQVVRSYGDRSSFIRSARARWCWAEQHAPVRTSLSSIFYLDIFDLAVDEIECALTLAKRWFAAKGTQMTVRSRLLNS